MKWGKTYSVLGEEDLSADHVSDTVADEGERGRDSPLRSSCDVGRDESPRHEQADHEGDGHEVTACLEHNGGYDRIHSQYTNKRIKIELCVNGKILHTPLGPFIRWLIWQERDSEEASHRRKSAEGHEDQSEVGYPGCNDADENEPEHAEDTARDSV